MLRVTSQQNSIPQTGAIALERASVERTTGGVSKEAQFIDQLTHNRYNDRTASFNDAAELPASAFELKTALAPYSMHLGRAWRQSLFSQIDEILCEDAWDFEDLVPSKSSWATLIRLVVYCKFKVLPGLGFANENPMLSWIHKNVRINITCYPNDLVRWTASRVEDGGIETSIGDAKPQRISAVLSAYNDNNWLFDGGS